MDIRFEFDFSLLDPAILAGNCITFDEIENVFYSQKSKYVDNLREENIAFVMGYSSKKKFISFYFQMKEDIV